MMLDMIPRNRNENRVLEILLKVFLVIGIVAGLCVIAKIIYDKFVRNNMCYCEADDFDFDDDLCCCCDDDSCDEDVCEGDIVGEAATGSEDENDEI